MQIVRNWTDIPPTLRGASVALGNFDGVHLGHALLLRAAHGGRPEVPLAVLTFEPHPREMFRPDDPPFRLTLEDERAELLAALGVRIVYQVAFNPGFAELTASQFLDQVVGAAIAPRHLCCGTDFAFGHRRGGDATTLARWCEQQAVGLTVVPPLADTDGQVSSTRIRRLLQDGYPERAALKLGRHWSIGGIVQHGDARGRLIGFPTANLQLGRHLEPARGVYAVRVGVDGGSHLLPGVANIGRRPTVGGAESRLEVHLFDWSGDLYGQSISVALHHFLRGERKFSGLDTLRDQIEQDATEARALVG